jgi:heptosyltransferase-3
MNIICDKSLQKRLAILAAYGNNTPMTMDKKHSNPQRILFVTATYLGDAIISTSVLETLRAQYPQAQFTIACGGVAAPIFQAFPNLEQLYVLRKHKAGLHWLKLWWSCVNNHWDMVVDLRGTGLSYFLCTKARKVWKSSGNTTQLRVQQMAAFMGLDKPAPCKIFVTAEHRKKAKALLPKKGPVLMLSPAANWDKKCWPGENFLELAKQLTAKNGLLPHAAIGILGSPDQRSELLPMLHAFPKEQQIDITGNVDLLTLAACLEQTDLFVGNDSGLMHLAAAMGTPTLGLFGPSRPEVYGPFGPRAAYAQVPRTYEDVMGAAEQGQNLMGLLTVEDVLKACKDLFTSRRARQ